VTRVIRENAGAFLGGPDAQPVEQWITFDRDACPDGIGGIYDAAKEEYWRGVEAGKTPGLKTAGTGTTSANCPLVAVGNTPCNGSNPPKYLDGFFDNVEVRDVSGQWVRVRRGESVAVRQGAPVMVRIDVTNLGEASWLSPKNKGETGTVYMVAAAEAEKTKTAIPRDLPRCESLRFEEVRILERAPEASIEVMLTFEVFGRTAFGPRFTFTTAPQ